MKNKCKKTLALLACGTLVLGAFAGCKDDTYKGDAITDYVAGQAVASNGGFAVEQGNFVYFINGTETYTASNEYGSVVKGALVRIAKADLAKGDYSKVKTIVPSLFVAQNYDAGVYIYGDYVYYATPTRDKNMAGDVQNTWIDFKRAKLDGTEAPMDDYFFRLSSNSANYRFVQENGTVYCLYEENSELKSYNCSKRKSTVLVKNAKSSFYYDETDAESPYVYYTMAVTTDAETDNAVTKDYDQLYRVNAAATVTKFNATEASYETSNGGKYDFSATEMKKAIDEAKENKTTIPYDLNNYAAYPYVNLGELVLDGVGSSQKSATQFNNAGIEGAATPAGYTYTISAYKNGGLYFTRANVSKTSSEGDSTKLYYVADETFDADSWNAVKDNDKPTAVANDTKNTASALFYTDKDGKQFYFYVDGAYIKKASLNDKAEVETVTFTKASATDATLWKIDGDYLYYYAASTAGSGNVLTRINYTGSQDDYNYPSFGEAPEYTGVTFPAVEWNASWYEPEIFGDTLLYSNQQTFGSNSYGYIYATKIPATQAELKASVEAYEAVQDKIDEYSEDTDLQSAMKYYFRTGETKAFDNAYKLELYDKNQKASFDEFVALFADNAEEKLTAESKFIGCVSKITASDKQAIANAWVNSLPTPETETKEETGLETWAIVLIIVGSVLVVAAGVLVPVLVVSHKKKLKKQEQEAIVNAGKKKIDTTDDKTIDVYADEEAVEETAQETTEEAPAEEPAQEVETEAEATEETPVAEAEETVEAVEPVEEVQAETTETDEKKDE